MSWWNALISIIDSSLRQRHSSHVLAFRVGKHSSPPHAEAPFLISRGKRSIRVVLNPRLIAETSSLMILIGCGVQTTADGGSYKVLLMRPQRATELGKMMEKDAFESVPVLAAVANVIAEFLQHPISAKSVPSPIKLQRPASSSDDICHKLMAIFEVALCASGHPETSISTQQDALIIRVDHMVELVAIACPGVYRAIGQTAPSCDMETIGIQSRVILHSRAL